MADIIDATVPTVEAVDEGSSGAEEDGAVTTTGAKPAATGGRKHKGPKAKFMSKKAREALAAQEAAAPPAKAAPAKAAPAAAATPAATSKPTAAAGTAAGAAEGEETSGAAVGSASGEGSDAKSGESDSSPFEDEDDDDSGSLTEAEEDDLYSEMVDDVGGSRSRHRFNGESRDIYISNLTLRVFGQDLTDAAILKLRHGERYGLVGRNGVGKSTLLAKIANHTIVGIPSWLRTLHVQQEIVGSDATALEAVMAADEERAALLEEAAELSKHSDAESGERLGFVYERLADIEADRALARASAVLTGLQFTEEMKRTPTKALSGGWRMRCALARALFLQPDLLLLDEPTNHLDIRSILWLQGYLQSYPHTVVVVSHDRAFLNSVTTQTIHFHNKQLKYYTGNYEHFDTARTNRRIKMQRLEDQLQQKRKHIEESVARMQRAAAKVPEDSKRASLVASRRKKLGKMGLEKTEDGQKWNCQKHGYRLGSVNANAGGWKGRQRQRASVAEAPEKKFQFEFPEPDDLATLGPLLQVRDVTFKYPGAAAPTLSNVTLDIVNGSRFTIVGRNGAGKTTLLNLISGSLEPTRGEVYRARNLRIVTFTQHHMEQLDPEKSPLQHMMDKFPGVKEQVLRGQLGSFGIHAGLALQKIGTLSGGQRSRVVFATLTYCRPQLLILDEPTNHLDLQTVEALVEAIKAFKGAVIVVSHDQFLMNQVGGELLSLKDGTLKRLDFSYATYIERLVERMAAETEA